MLQAGVDEEEGQGGEGRQVGPRTNQKQRQVGQSLGKKIGSQAMPMQEHAAGYMFHCRNVTLESME